MENSWIKISSCFEKVIDYRGKTPKKLGGDWTDKGYMALSALNVKTDGLNLDSIKFVNEDLYKKWMRDEVKKGDILLTSEAPAGQVFVWNSDEKIVLSQRLFALRINRDFNNYFIKYFLQSKTGQGEIERNTTGSTVSGISAQMFELIRVPKINLSNQESIASVLKSIDSKIELNKTINIEIQKTAKMLYSYWFVQFDFPNEAGAPYKSNGGRMVWSDALKTEIPNGWKVQRISEIIRDEKNGDWGKEKKTQKYTDKVFCIRGADINGLNGKEFCNPPQRFISTNSTDKILLAHDLIIEISGGSPRQSTGRIAHISLTTKNRFTSPLVCSNFCKAITLTDSKFAYNFLFFWERLYDNNIFFGYEGKTSGIKNLLFNVFVKTNYILIPDENTKNNFFDFMERVQEKKEKLLEENQRLVELRDWLLPMLMNGQVVVK